MWSDRTEEGKHLARQATESLARYLTLALGAVVRLSRAAAARTWPALVLLAVLLWLAVRWATIEAARLAAAAWRYILTHWPLWAAAAREGLRRAGESARRMRLWAVPILASAARRAAHSARQAAIETARVAGEGARTAGDTSRNVRTHARAAAAAAREGLRRAGESARHLRLWAVPILASAARRAAHSARQAAIETARVAGDGARTADDASRNVWTHARAWAAAAREGLRRASEGARRAWLWADPIVASAARAAGSRARLATIEAGRVAGEGASMAGEASRNVRTHGPVWAAAAQNGLSRVSRTMGIAALLALRVMIVAGRQAGDAWQQVRAHGPAVAAPAQRYVARALPGVPLAIRWVRAELGHQLREAQDARPRFRPLRDRRGRRLRASAYARHRGAARSGGDLGGMYGSGIRRACTVLATVGVVGMGSFLGGAQAFVDYSAYLPDVHSLRSTPLPQDTVIYAADGTQLADLHSPGVMHYEQSLDQMGTLLPQAAVAVEDANFWTQPGIDPQGVARAALADFQKGRAVQGGSTITQQLARVRLLNDRSVNYQRKIKEAILALQIERTYNKSQILEMYLNSVHFGNQSLGVEAAAQNYFRKNTASLDLAEASMLAGIPQSPLYNDPVGNWGGAKVRQKQVLDAMVRHGLVTDGEAAVAYAKDLKPELNYPPDSVRGAPSFVAWTVDQLVARYGKQATYEGGLRVYTTLNPQLQAIAEETVRTSVDNNRPKNVNQGAMTAIDPKTGGVLAMVGSAYRDRFGGQVNYATDVPLNPGSSFKIFTYAAGIESRKYVQDTPIMDVPLTVSMPGQEPNWKPANYNGKFGGTCALQVCMGNSLNVPAVQVELGTGVDQVVNMARKLGAPPFMPHYNANGTLSHYSQDDPPTSFGASLTLGGYGETPLQMATGAATIAGMGLYHPATGILRITDRSGNPIYTYDPGQVARQVLDPKVAFIMQTIMSTDENRQAIFGRNSALTLPGRLAGAKTGTTNDWRDAWTVGYTPAMASAFWFGNPDNSPMAPEFDAIFAAAPGWQNYMKRALDVIHEPANDWFAPPPGLVKGSGNVWLLPGTTQRQPPAPLPPWARLDTSKANKDPNKDPNNPSNQNN